MFRAKDLGAENRRDTHRPTLTPPRLSVMASQGTILKPCPRISFCGLGTDFDFSGRKRRVDFGVTCLVRGKLAPAHPKTTRHRRQSPDDRVVEAGRVRSRKKIRCLRRKPENRARARFPCRQDLQCPVFRPAVLDMITDHERPRLAHHAQNDRGRASQSRSALTCLSCSSRSPDRRPLFPRLQLAAVKLRTRKSVSSRL
jgi:hypothetical protein